MPELGRRMYAQNIVLRGCLDESEWLSFLSACAEAMNMSAAGIPGVWRYPVDGKGGTGVTIVQPITESFLVVDTWPDHDGAYMHVASCKRFSIEDIAETILKFGLAMDFAGRIDTLHLDPLAVHRRFNDYVEQEP